MDRGTNKIICSASSYDLKIVIKAIVSIIWFILKASYKVGIISMLCGGCHSLWSVLLFRYGPSSKIMSVPLHPQSSASRGTFSHRGSLVYRQPRASPWLRVWEVVHRPCKAHSSCMLENILVSSVSCDTFFPHAIVKSVFLPSLFSSTPLYFPNS
jgi:hypothetical protein